MSHPSPKHLGHRRNQSSDRTLALQSFEPYPKTPLSPHLPAYAEEQLYDTELSLDPSWDEAYAATGLPPLARAYLAERHGTLDLDPMPSASDDDPYNWPGRTKACVLALVALHAFLATLGAGAVAPARADLAAALGTTPERAAHLASAQTAVLGAAPLAWRPLADAYGRRPAFLLSLLASGLGNVGCALSPTYGALVLFRVLAAFSASPASALGGAVVAEMFLRRERARYVGIWTVMVTLGAPAGPLAFGPVAHRAGFRWVFWALAIANAALLALYLLLGRETLYARGPQQDGAPPPPCAGAGEKQKKPSGLSAARYLGFRRISPRGLAAADFVEPLRLAARPRAALPALAYSTAFLFGSVLTTVEIPTLLGQKFGLDAEEVGLQFVGVVIGTLLGEQVGGTLSDLWMRRARSRTGSDAPPEFRLWLSYLGYVLTVAGVAVFLTAAERAPASRGTVVPVVGTAIAAMGNQVVTTVLVTYAIDCAPEQAASVGVFVSLARQLTAFLGPFW